MGMEYLRTPHGLITFGQILIGAAAMFACSFVWETGDVYWLIFLGNHGGILYVVLALFATWIVAIGIFGMQVSGNDILERLGKIRVVMIHLACFVLMLIVAALETHYSANSVESFFYRPRFITVAVFSYIMLVSYIVQVILILCCQ